MNGQYIKYNCPICGWFYSIKITKGNEKVVEKLFKQKVKKHMLSYRLIE